ncbi:hypothetical protein [Streptomyces sp. NPDC047928]|uniref:hypothetical protein n=1 Tax=unclassified Streptomyces TaxID=2593676 RepID=UPI003713A9F4
MSLAPRAVLVHRTTEYEELLVRHGTHGHAEFFLRTHGQGIGDVLERHHRTKRALAAAVAAVPLTWRQARVERADLDRFLFAPEDVVVVVGQDGLVANAAKYLSGQPVVGIDSEPGRNPGVLVRHRAGRAPALLKAALSRRSAVDELTMVEAVTDDAQRLVALNEIYVGQAGHQTARYLLAPEEDVPPEHQASSGVVVGTGTGATGWLRSLSQQRGGARAMPGPADRALAWFVREAWASPATGTSLVEGVLGSAARLRLTVESDRLVAFGDGMETDALQLTRGQTVRLGVSDTALRLVT